MTRNDDATSRGTRTEPRVSSEGEASQNEGEEGEKMLPMYTITPVDRYGNNKEQTEPLQDLGTCTCTCMTVMRCTVMHMGIKSYNVNNRSSCRAISTYM